MSGAFLVLCCILVVLMHDNFRDFYKPAQYHFLLYPNLHYPNICDRQGNVLLQPVVHQFMFTAQEGEWTSTLHGVSPTSGLWKIQSEGSIISLCALSPGHMHLHDFSKAVCEPIQLNTYFNNNCTNNNFKSANGYHGYDCVLLKIIPVYSHTSL